MQTNILYRKLIAEPRRIAPLITFRILFGGLMMVGALRFMLSGWVERLYVEPKFFFKFYGFEWVEALGRGGMYGLYCLIAASAAMIMLGWFYRQAAVVFFLAFTYSELIGLTNYLNHYYLVCLLAFMLIFLPAHRRFSIDAWRSPELSVTHVPAWVIHIILLQLGLVYFFAGFAKLNPDWLFRAMPLAVWLPTKAHWPILGPWLELPWLAFAFSWAGAAYDLTIPFWLLWRRSRPVAYLAVLVFHLLTRLLFNIGLFPFIMIFNTLIFFPPAFHEKLLGQIGYRPGKHPIVYAFPSLARSVLRPALFLYFCFQLLFPLRYLCYPGNVLWTEQGYRFSWRVMLLEKAGQATFYVHDPESGHKAEVDNSRYLTDYQEKQMAFQPDMILQYAHFLEKEYCREYNLDSVKVTVDCFVALNGRPSRRFINPNIDLAQLEDGLAHKSWILPHPENEHLPAVSFSNQNQ
ncbi:MAG: HTTM domain-containing protein [Phaeodactylibacter sp.]|nr:HTTM domain-containing protein [Phaeodactylibacter sp.]MCB9263715.1 HTTM domain-containing protein [Lewinellaceae bacterium]MCB9286878.1 HTTM domain-containing protein [Lewinellaceae bacterium]